MIELIAHDGARLFLNPDGIWHVRGSGTDTTEIYATTGAKLLVRGAVEEIAARIAEWRHNDRLRMRPRLHVVKKDDD